MSSVAYPLLSCNGGDWGGAVGGNPLWGDSLSDGDDCASLPISIVLSVPVACLLSW